MRFFTSDLHFFHNLVHRKYRNKFSTIHDMNHDIIATWNKTVGHKDKVYVIGDVSFGKFEETKALVQQLNGNKVLIRGNHDERFTTKQLIEIGFNEVRDTLEIKIENKKYLLSHYPYSSSIRFFYYKYIINYNSTDNEANYYKKYLSYKGYPLIHGHHHEQRINYFNSFNVTYDKNKRLISEIEIHNSVQESNRNVLAFLFNTIKAILW